MLEKNQHTQVHMSNSLAYVFTFDKIFKINGFNYYQYHEISTFLFEQWSMDTFHHITQPNPA